MAQLVKHLTLAQVMISWFVSSSPTLGSVWTAQSLEPASDSVSPFLSVPPLFAFCLCLSLSLLTNKQTLIFFLKIPWVEDRIENRRRAKAEAWGLTGSPGWWLQPGQGADMTDVKCKRKKGAWGEAEVFGISNTKGADTIN